MDRNPLKITFIVANPDLSGGDRVVAEQARLMKQAGHTVQVIGVDTHQTSMRDYARALVRTRRLPEVYIRTDHFQNADIPISVIKRPVGPRIEDVPDADVIIATWWQTAEWIAPLPDSKGAKMYFIQGFEPLYPSVRDPERVRATYSLDFHHIGVCQWLCDEVNAVSGRTGADGCQLVENGIDLEVFSSPPREKNPVPTIGYLYTFAGFKNPSLALQSVEALRARLPTVNFVSFGAHPETAAFPLPEPTDFRLRPTPQGICEAYAACDVWLLSSDHEGFGLPLLEAMACHTPVVATRAGASPEIVTPQTGTLCEERSVEAFSSAIESVLALSPEEWREMSKNARAMAERYNWERAGRAFEDNLYATLERGQR